MTDQNGELSRDEKIVDLLDKIKDGSITEKEWGEFVELTHLEDGE